MAKKHIENLKYEHHEIKKLDISLINAKIDKIEFNKLPGVEWVNISNMSLSEIPREICKLNLKCLKAMANIIYEVPELNVEELDLTYNLITKFPIIKNIKKIYLGYNNISEIPNEITNLNNLEEIILKANYKISKLPNELFELKKLRVLDLSMTSIDKIPYEINNLDNLEVLRIQNTKIRELPEIRNPKLREINIEKTKIKEIPHSLMKRGIIIHI